MANTLSVFPRVPTTKGVNGRNLVGPCEPCTYRSLERKAFLCGEAPEEKPTVEAIHGKNPESMERRKNPADET